MSWKDYKPDWRPISVIKAEERRKRRNERKKRKRQPRPIHKAKAKERFAVNGKAGYARYLTTSHWKKVRKAMMGRNRYRCQECRHTGEINVHHLNYDRLWEELGSDFAVLCRNCHKYEHFGLPGIGSV